MFYPHPPQSGSRSYVFTLLHYLFLLMLNKNYKIKNFVTTEKSGTGAVNEPHMFQNSTTFPTSKTTKDSIVGVEVGKPFRQPHFIDKLWCTYSVPLITNHLVWIIFNNTKAAKTRFFTLWGQTVVDRIKPRRLIIPKASHPPRAPRITLIQ